MISCTADSQTPRTRRHKTGLRHTGPLCLALIVLGLSTPLAAVEHAARALVRETTERLLVSPTELTGAQTPIQASKQTPGAVRAEVASEVVPHFDLDMAARRVLGKHWDRANAAQRARFLAIMERYVIDAYAGFVLDYRGERVEYLPTRELTSGERARVRTRVVEGNGRPVRVDYAVRLAQGQWKVYDVAANGVSLLTLYRAEFENVIRLHGLDGLLAQLDEKFPPS